MAASARTAVTELQEQELSPLSPSPGFTTLPTELLHKIVSYTQTDVIAWNVDWILYSSYRVNRDTLCTLSQLCRSLREVFLPLLWERLEACALTPSYEMQCDDMQWRMLFKQLSGQLNLIVDNKNAYASYVRVIVATVGEHIPDCLLASLAECMTLMPNLHTVQIISLSHSSSRGYVTVDPIRFREAFGSYTYPSVKKIIIPMQARTIFSCFPDAREVYLNQLWVYNFTDFIDALVLQCPKVETLGCIELFHEPRTPTIVKKLSQLQKLVFQVTEYKVDEISMLSELPQLGKIILIDSRILSSSEWDKRKLEVVKAAKDVLAASSLPERCLDLVLGTETHTFIFDDLM